MKAIDEFMHGVNTARDEDASLTDLIGGPEPKYGSALGDDELTSLRRKVEDLQTEGWHIEREYDDRVVMRYGDLGSILVHIILFAFTVGVGNAVYAWYRWTRYGQQKVVRP